MGYTNNMIDKLKLKYDWLMYRLAYQPINRICKRNPGIGYLIELHIRDWRGKNLPTKLKRSAESFYDELKKQEK